MTEPIIIDYTLQLDIINTNLENIIASLIRLNNDIRVIMYLLAILLSYLVIKNFFKRS